MSRMFKVMALAAGLAAPASFAHAGVYADDLTRCLVKSTSPADQTALMVWMFGAMSVHPTVHGYVNMTPAAREAGVKGAGDVFVRLITADCRKESVNAIKYEGAPSLGEAFKVLGETAMRGFAADPQVAEGMAALGKYADSPGLQAVLKDAGVGAEPVKK